MPKPGFPRFATLGDRALVVQLGDQIDTVTFRAIKSLTRTDGRNQIGISVQPLYNMRAQSAHVTG